MIDRSPAALDKLRADGCDVLVYACTGEFPPMAGDENVLFPSRVLAAWRRACCRAAGSAC